MIEMRLDKENAVPRRRYRIHIRGGVPPDLYRRISAVHAAALSHVKTRPSVQIRGGSAPITSTVTGAKK